MNKLFLIIALFAINCRAQTNVINLTETVNNNNWNMNDGNSYFKDINGLISPYLGTWKWIQGDKEMILTLIKQEKYHYTQGQNYYEDRVVGYYVYKENGIVIADTSNDNLNEEYVKVIFSLGPSFKISSIAFYDYLKKKDYDVWLELISSTQMKFHGKEDTDIIQYRRGTHTIYPGTTFPLEMIFTKQ
ncbi:DUF6705 family protein [Chryseobacterium gleum]|uniref:DUF6705 family protein n=1 Tax=Chryseobacterium gleum TaxID=250 RepID=UPI0028ABF1F7|nr:DUF6705 family protein [Chryseobacterium gleum]